MINGSGHDGHPIVELRRKCRFFIVMLRFGCVVGVRGTDAPFMVIAAIVNGDIISVHPSGMYNCCSIGGRPGNGVMWGSGNVDNVMVGLALGGDAWKRLLKIGRNERSIGQWIFRALRLCPSRRVIG
jgi:hypothetical protein